MTTAYPRDRPPAPRTARSPWSLGGPSPAARLPLVGRPGRRARRLRAAGRAGAIGRRLGGRRLGVRPRAGVDRPPLRRPWQLCAGRGRELAPLHRRRPALPARRRAHRTGVGPRGGRGRCAPAAPWRLDLSGRARGGRAGRGRRRHRRDGSRGGPRARPARGPRPGRRRAGSHRLARALVAVQRGEQGRDVALRGHVLAAHARRAARGVRLAFGRRHPAAALDRGARGNGRRAVARHAADGDHDLGDELRADVRPRGGHRLCALRRGPLPGGSAGGASPARRGRRDDGQRRQGRAGQRPGSAGLRVGGDAGAEPAIPHERARDPARRRVRARCLADAAAGGARAAGYAHRQLRPAVGRSGAAPQPGLRSLGASDLAPPGVARHAWRRLSLVHSGAAGTRAAHGDAHHRGAARRRQRASRLRADAAGIRRGRAGGAAGRDAAAYRSPRRGHASDQRRESWPCGRRSAAGSWR